MMGTRSGSIDPSIVPLVMCKQNANGDKVMELLNSGLLGIAWETYEMRELVRRGDDAARLALAVFSWRIRIAAGSYLGTLGDAEGVIVGGGIGEDTPIIRAEVCQGLKGAGLKLDEPANARSTSGQARVSKTGSGCRLSSSRWKKRCKSHTSASWPS